ncbi:MAG TPA: beta-galactosidase [Candidatus Paceibacterota bacterium]|nr:beta-galactosidase [Candidatus Pacearchaeota archaeon]HRZ50695.1 beta-galactosidase [Candidatus Paceibacterota bacterium]HSA36408.1 beta-galactosidase [Candidatus Paceibacterota bacterium]
MAKKSMWLAIIIGIFALILAFFYLYKPPRPATVDYGAVFSQKHAANLGLDWKETYLALLSDLQVKNMKIAAHWDLLEPGDGQYDFTDLDWQLDRAKEHGANVMLVIGMKTPRWPECHIPGWAAGLEKNQQQEKILDLLETIVLRYRDRSEISVWQVENEPFFSFGDCPWRDPEFLEKEAALVRSIDGKFRPVLISDSGEGSLWTKAAGIGDIVGVTMYRKVWFHEAKTYMSYPIPPAWYWAKAEFIKAAYHKKTICVELQAEPWCPSLLYNCSLSEQEKTMDLKQFKGNLAFARDSGFDTFYLWGSEWWYWQKTKNNNPAFWEEAKKNFRGSRLTKE